MTKPNFEKMARSSVATLRKHDHDDFWLGFIEGVASDCYDLGQQSQWRTDIDAMEFYTHYAVAIGGKVYSPCRRSLTKDNAIDIYQDGASDIVVDFSKIRAFYEVTPPKEGE